MLHAVVVNYRTPGDLDEFLESWERFPTTFERTLAVMNVDPLPEDRLVAEKYAREGVVVHEFPSNVGYARACNRGALLGGGEVLALFNADIVLTEGALEQCVSALLGDPTWGVLGPCQVDQHNRFVHAGIVGSPSAPRHRAWFEKNRGQYIDVLDDVPTVAGSAYFIRRKVWDKLTECPSFWRVAPDAQGAFLPTRHFYEETYCSTHARAHGWKCVYFGRVTIVHKFHRASPVGGVWANRMMVESREYFRTACDAHEMEHN